MPSPERVSPSPGMSPSLRNGRFSIFIVREKVFPAGLPDVFGLDPEPVHEVKVRARRREGVREAAGKGGQENVRLQLHEPGGQAGDVLLSHAGNLNNPNGIASELTYVCPPLV